MIHHIFTVFDSKAVAYMTPFFSISKGAAVRSFSDTLEDCNHPFAKHPEDYVLFQLGTYDDVSAIFDCYSPVSIGVAIEFKKPDLVPRASTLARGVEQGDIFDRSQ